MAPFRLVKYLIPLCTLGSPGFSLDGNELLRYCDEDSANYQRAFCTGFIVGVSSGIEVGTLKAGYAAGLPDDDWDSIHRYAQIVAGYCEPERLEYGQLVDIVVKFLRNHPEGRHQNAEILTGMAFMDAFPCP